LPVSSSGEIVLKAPQPDTKKEVKMKEDVAQPRSPGAADRQRIITALDEHYLTKEESYKGSHSDASIGRSLNVPWAWVKEVREFAFGGHDRNESQKLTQKELLVFEQKVVELRARLASAFDIITSVDADLAAMQKKIAA
jgi:hypothetical protein